MPAEPPETGVETPIETVSACYSASEHGNPTIPSPRQMPPFRRRLPRFVRAKRSWRPPLALQGRDLALLRTVHEYHLITTSQFLLLFGDESKDGIYRRLQKLFHHGYLNRIGTNPNAPMLYAIGRRAAEVLEVPLSKSVRERYVAHQLMIGNFRIALTLAARERGIEVMWPRLPADLPIRPDGPRQRFLGKLAAYERWNQAGGHTVALGIRHFRVLTVTKSEERIASLMAPVLNGARPAFWFTSEGRFAPGAPVTVIDPIWRISGQSREERGLIPASEESCPQ